MSNQIVEVFGEFVILLNGEKKFFATEAEARAALVIAENEAAFRERAAAFVTAYGVNEITEDGKANKQFIAKVNAIVQFLAFEASVQISM